MSKQQVNEAGAKYSVQHKKKVQRNTAESLITQHLDLWSSAIASKNTTGRGSNKKIELYGVKKLRELILELAVRGKLVPQDPNDEPASELLKRIDAEAERLVADKKIKKPKKLPEITDEEKPFELPSNWSFVRFGNLTSRLGSGSTPRGGKNAYVSMGIPFLRSQNVWNEGLRLDDIAYIPDETHEKMENTKVYPGDVLLNITGASLGRSTIFPSEISEANVSQHVTIIRLIEPLMARFVHLGILSPMIQSLVWGRQVGMAIEGLSKKVLENFEFPIPPLKEQHRIVAKVDELMALCDQLENQTEQSLDAHATLADTLLDALTQAQSHTELMENWLRLEQNWDILFPSNIAGQRTIDKLKQTILQLAVMGKLVPQDPTDEPASELLKRIAAEKEQLIKDKKIKKQKPLPPIADEEKPFELPEGWEWCRLGDCALLKGGNAYKSQLFVDASPYQLVRMGNIRPDYLRLDEKPVYLSEPVALADTDYEIHPGSILVTMTGTKGKKDYLYTVLVCESDLEKRLFLNQRLCMLEPLSMLPSFVSLSMKEERLLELVYSQSTGTANQANSSMVAISEWLIPVPPLEEQKRIVTKVEELTTFCDQLKQRLQTAQQTQQQFTDAVVAGALTNNSETSKV